MVLILGHSARQEHDAQVGLAPGIGVIELRLLPETKTNRPKGADVGPRQLPPWCTNIGGDPSNSPKRTC